MRVYYKIGLHPGPRVFTLCSCIIINQSNTLRSWRPHLTPTGTPEPARGPPRSAIPGPFGPWLRNPVGAEILWTYPRFLWTYPRFASTKHQFTTRSKGILRPQGLEVKVQRVLDLWIWRCRGCSSASLGRATLEGPGGRPRPPADRTMQPEALQGQLHRWGDLSAGSFEMLCNEQKPPTDKEHQRTNITDERQHQWPESLH